jgi:choline dehydrogenase
VDIRSDNPFQLAAADDAFYQDPADLLNMQQAIQVYIKGILAQFAIYSAPPLYQPIPGDPFQAVIDANYSDASVIQYIKNNTNLSLDIHHFVSHCKMAPLDQGGVVDGETRVHGTYNVFVADNAICPSIPDINTTAPAMMIGLRASEILGELFDRKRRR